MDFCLKIHIVSNWSMHPTMNKGRTRCGTKACTQESASLTKQSSSKWAQHILKWGSTSLPLPTFSTGSWKRQHQSQCSDLGLHHIHSFILSNTKKLKGKYRTAFHGESGISLKFTKALTFPRQSNDRLSHPAVLQECIARHQTILHLFKLQVPSDLVMF